MRPEIELLLCCARTHLEDAHTTRVQTLLRQGIDWDRLLRLAGAHGVEPLLYWNLHAIRPDAVPKAVLSGLRDRFFDNAQHNLLRTQELLRVLALLRASGVSAVPLKGPVLAAAVYGNLALREFIDLDVLVRPADAGRAREAMLAGGYRLRAEVGRGPGLTGRRSQRECQLASADGRVGIDLQWHIPADWRAVRTFPLDASGIWERLESLALAGVAVPTFAPADLMLILCVHGASHGWAELRFVCDVAEVLRAHPELDLEETLAQAATLGVARMLLLGLRLAHDLLGASLPGQVRHRVQADRAVVSLTRQVGEWMFGQPEIGYLPRRFQEALFSIRLRERLQDKLPYVFYFLDYPRRHVRAWLRLRSAAAA